MELELQPGIMDNNILISNPGIASDNGMIRIGTSGTHNQVHLPGALYLADSFITPAATSPPDHYSPC